MLDTRKKEITALEESLEIDRVEDLVLAEFHAEAIRLQEEMDTLDALRDNYHEMAVERVKEKKRQRGAQGVDEDVKIKKQKL